MRDVSERDWKLFRKKLPGWQEAYMERLCKEYIELLSSESKASERFWKLEKRLTDDRKICLASFFWLSGRTPLLSQRWARF